MNGSIERRIRKAWERAMIDLGDSSPKHLFLGNEEWHELARYCELCTGTKLMSHPRPTDENRRAEYMRMKVYVVDAQHFLHVS